MESSGCVEPAYAENWTLLGVTHASATGYVVDRPLSTCPSAGLPQRRFYSAATFTAYAGQTIVDSESSKVDFGFTLAGSRPVDRVVVQVYRFPTSPIDIGQADDTQSAYPRRNRGREEVQLCRTR
jgi:hypothetical protein